jgi:hypothetical protein
MERLEVRMTANIEPSHQTTINSMVGRLIAQRGYYAVIDELIAAVYNLGEISLADPENRSKLRNFDMWAQAVRTAVLKHNLEFAFENRLTAPDRRLAAEMKIRLD